MTVFIIVVLLAAGILFAVWFGGDGARDVLLLFPVLALVGLGALVAHEYGTGKLCILSLESNAIYETLSSVPDGAGKYAVILKEQDGSLSAYLLQKDPPKMFKYTPDNKDNPFQPFPPVSPAPSIPPKK